MKYCHEQAVELLKKHNPSLADAIALAPLERQAEASILAAAFFSSEFRDQCLSELQLQREHTSSWFEPSINNQPEIQTVDELKRCFKQSSQHVIQAIGAILNPSHNPKITTLIEEVVVAIKITTWINQLGENPTSFSLLPLALIDEFTLDIESIKTNQKVPENLARALAVLMGEARQSFVRLYHQLNQFDLPVLLAVYTAVKFHEALLDEIIWAKFELFTSVQEVSSLRRKFIMFKAKRAVRKLS